LGGAIGPFARRRRHETIAQLGVRRPHLRHPRAMSSVTGRF
jgi:hypothetical protein